MSWLARSITNSLRLDDQDHDAVQSHQANDSLSPRYHHSELPHATDADEDPDQGRGVKEDLSEFKESLTRQLWGVASFLAPPPPPPPPPLKPKSILLISESKSELSGSDEEDNKYSEVPNYSQSEDYNISFNNDNNIIEEAIGITEEVLTFASNIAHHPETWLDFPLSDEENFDDFDITDAQYKHVLAVEHLAPRLAALRNELCPAHMSEGYFWMVYFVLLHSRLKKHDANLLLSPQLVEARAMWMQELQKQTKEDSYWPGSSSFQSKERSADPSPREYSMMHQHQDPNLRNMSPFEYTMHHITAQCETDNPLHEIEFIDKSVIKEDPSPKFQEKEMIMESSTRIPVQLDYIDDDDDDDWLKEDSDLVVLSGTSMLINEEDISFSDLEEDIDCSMPFKSELTSTERNMITKTS